MCTPPWNRWRSYTLRRLRTLQTWPGNRSCSDRVVTQRATRSWTRRRSIHSNSLVASRTSSARTGGTSSWTLRYQDAVNTAAFDVSMGYMTVHNEEEDRDEWYIVQFEIDYSESDRLDLQQDCQHLQARIQQRVMAGAYGVHLGRHGALQHNYLQGDGRRITALQGADMEWRIHVEAAKGFAGDDTPTKGVEWQAPRPWLDSASRNMEDTPWSTTGTLAMRPTCTWWWTTCSSITWAWNIPDDRLEQHPGHPGYADYIREELLHGRLLGTPEDTVEDMTVDTMAGWGLTQDPRDPQFCGWSTSGYIQGTVWKCTVQVRVQDLSYTATSAYQALSCTRIQRAVKGATTSIQLYIYICIYIWKEPIDIRKWRFIGKTLKSFSDLWGLHIDPRPAISFAGCSAPRGTRVSRPMRVSVVFAARSSQPLKRDS